jgi:hypothetical protein
MLAAKKQTWLTREDIYSKIGIKKNNFLKDVEPHLTISKISAYKRLYSLESLEKFIEKNVLVKANN